MNELEGRLLKRIANMYQINVHELPSRQRELESKMEKLLRSDDLPSFGTSTSSTFPTSLEMRLNKMEVNHDNLVAENKKLQACIHVLEESRNPTTIRQIADRLDSVIRMVNSHEADSYQVNQSMTDIQQEVIALRQEVDACNEEDTQVHPTSDEQQEDQDQEDQEEVARLPLLGDRDAVEQPPGLSPPASIAGSATTIIVSTLELPLFKGSN